MYTPLELEQEWIRRATVDFDSASSKIIECFNELKDKSLNETQLEYDIQYCACSEIDIFTKNWRLSAPKELINTPNMYTCGLKTFNLYIELVELPKKLIASM